MSEKLLPCPFCGGEAEYHVECEMVTVRCSICGATTSGWWDEPEEAIAEWNRRADGWISVEERLPEHSNVVLVALRHGLVCEGSYFDIEQRWIRFGVPYMPVTHWMPLPELPERSV